MSGSLWKRSKQRNDEENTHTHTHPVVTLYLVELEPRLCCYVMRLMWALAYVCHRLLSHAVFGSAPQEERGRPRMFCYSQKWANECSRGGGWLGDRTWGGDVMDSIKSKHTASWQRLNNGLSLLHLFTGLRRGRKQLLRLCVRIKVKINWNVISKWGPRESFQTHIYTVSRTPLMLRDLVAQRDAAWTQIQLMKNHNRTAEICHY